MTQIQLFPIEPELPEGFVYKLELISYHEEQELVRAIEELRFAEVKMRDVVAKRRVAHFGRSYEYETAALGSAPPVPEFLLPLRQRVAEFAGRDPEEFAEVLVTDYPPGAPIGWHRDVPQFEIIIGISLKSSCRFRFKPYRGEGTIVAVSLEPRSAYILSGAARWQYQHSIPAVKTLRYSITFRTWRSRTPGRRKTSAA